ncbi:uncharacterized protein [Antedon mediterranea]|uniref:uncharacterized protein n=1 Tax=Antedon mediterranea TaxID=105859 RepID=UPI003AF583FA
MAETETNDRFLQLKVDLNRCYDSKRYYKQKIRFLLSDYLPFDLLEKSTTTLVLLYNIERHNRGLITPSNVDLLFEITQILQVKEAEDLVNQYMEENNVQITNHRTLSRYRMKMFRALEEVSTDVRHLTVYYKLYKNFQNVWDLVLKLEMANYLADEPDKLGKFARLLNPTAKAILLDYGSCWTQKTSGRRESI